MEIVLTARVYFDDEFPEYHPAHFEVKEELEDEIYKSLPDVEDVDVTHGSLKLDFGTDDQETAAKKLQESVTILSRLLMQHKKQCALAVLDSND
jgi:hypothetical protein